MSAPDSAGKPRWRPGTHQIHKLFASTLVQVSTYQGIASTAHVSQELGDGVPSLTFIRRGTHLHHAHRRAAVIEPGSSVLYRGDQPFRLSHPFITEHPDESLFLEFGKDLLGEVFGDRSNGRELGLLVPQPVLLETALMRSSMAARALDPMEGEERALYLLAAQAGTLAHAPPGLPKLTARAWQAVSRIRELVSTESAFRHSLPALALHAQCTPFHLTRLFRQATGMTITRYRLHVRLARVLDALEGGESDLTRLAADVGFSDHAHLTHSVRQAFGAPPSALRSALTRAAASQLRNSIQATRKPRG
ncbi:helix-turn-helix transcriptional regulator [Ramlibacter tataouinensis]|uniref:Transcriptional regulator, AraC family-like protein n=1 Tax=Ramlibacter tataouinensis (strain ATCC BAA-407 / DSM 14655 / LMG 21543 / TTB310) TaxID=365046 RepID=F5Y5X2_RAMTT|nr:AraC family transcriptional regulator [Ramlibacter tataouinensis]AEG91476.1 transcriptional regulator, AraC family-like protein [Ramlibacter tataouinensis TTB310]